MAYAELAEPGSEYGPCGDNCCHRDCAETRRMAAEFCEYCGRAIGYGRRFCGSVTERGDLVHWSCIVDAMEAGS